MYSVSGVQILKQGFSWSKHSTEEESQRVVSVACVVASYQFNRSSMNGRIGFLKVPVSPRVQHFLTPL